MNYFWVIFSIFWKTGLPSVSLVFKNMLIFEKKILFDFELQRNNRYVSTVHEVCLYRPRPCSIVLEVCFDRARSMFRPRSKYVLTVLQLCFDRARGKFRPCSRYVSNVLEACFDRARLCLTVLDCAQPCSRYILSLCLNQTPVLTIVIGRALKWARTWKFKYKVSTSTRLNTVNFHWIVFAFQNLNTMYRLQQFQDQGNYPTSLCVGEDLFQGTKFAYPEPFNFFF